MKYILQICEAKLWAERVNSKYIRSQNSGESEINLQLALEKKSDLNDIYIYMALVGVPACQKDEELLFYWADEKKTSSITLERN